MLAYGLGQSFPIIIPITLSTKIYIGYLFLSNYLWNGAENVKLSVKSSLGKLLQPHTCFLHLTNSQPFIKIEWAISNRMHQLKEEAMFKFLRIIKRCSTNGLHLCLDVVLELTGILNVQYWINPFTLVVQFIKIHYTKIREKCSYFSYTLQLFFTTATIFQQFFIWATIFSPTFLCVVCKGLKIHHVTMMQIGSTEGTILISLHKAIAHKCWAWPSQATMTKTNLCKL